MGHQPDYRCTLCNNEREREDLLAKKVSFLTLGARGKTIQSRTAHWVCLNCLAAGKDPDWNLQKYDSPGLRNAQETEARAIEARRNRRNRSNDIEA